MMTVDRGIDLLCYQAILASTLLYKKGIQLRDVTLKTRKINTKYY